MGCSRQNRGYVIWINHKFIDTIRGLKGRATNIHASWMYFLLIVMGMINDA